MAEQMAQQMQKIKKVPPKHRIKSRKRRKREKKSRLAVNTIFTCRMTLMPTALFSNGTISPA